MAKKNNEYRENNLKFLEENATKPGVVTTYSGLQYKIINQGNGPKPQKRSVVLVYYKGTFINGKQFDSNMSDRYPAAFRTNELIRGWGELLTYMSVGSTFEAYIPYNLGYGERGVPGIRPYSTLIFRVKLVSIG